MLRRLGIALLAFTAATPLHAAPQVARFDFKGVKATDKYATHAGLFKSCREFLGFNGCDFADPDVSGKHAQPMAGWAPDGSLVVLRGKFSSIDYQAIREAFEAKWGKPSASAALPVQNRFGARYQLPIAIWKFAEGEMTLTGSAAREDGSFEFMTNARKAEMKALQQPKVDF